jgi:hypothetical protein
MTRALHTLTGPFNGLAEKIAFIRSCYPRTISDGRIREYTERNALGRDRLSQLRSLYAAVRRDVRYFPDPVGVELTKAPSVLLSEIEERGYASGDCDDHACLNFTLLQTMGVYAVLRVTWHGGPQPRHIYAVAFHAGREYPFDTTRNEPPEVAFGREPSYSRKEDR